MESDRDEIFIVRFLHRFPFPRFLAVAVLQRGRVDHGGEDQAEGVDQEVAVGRRKEGCRDGSQREGRDTEMVKTGGVAGLLTGAKGCHPTFKPHVRFRADWVCSTL